ncbi:hypothetical protein [Runella sp.]|uniref:hypothetical protein n=1 Tax=Runella sp. TaxID=1960881 RepID=UPI003019C992
MQENTHTKALLECIEPDSTIWFWNESKPEKMPYAFRKMNDNFSNWFDDQDQREEITRRFKNELSDGQVTDIYLNKIRQSWDRESHYQDLINWYTEQHLEVWKNSLSKQTEISKAYPFLREWVKEGRTLEEEPRNAWETYLCLANEANEASTALKVLKSYCKAALWFIQSSKNIVENWEGVKIATPPTTSTDTNEGKKVGRTNDPEILTFINAQFGDVLRTMVKRNGITFQTDKDFELVCLLYAIKEEVNGAFDLPTCQKLALFFGTRIYKSGFSRKNPYSSSKDKPTKNLFSQRVDFMVKQLKATAKEKSINYKVPVIE